jgi:trehalose 6-phosphate synthase
MTTAEHPDLVIVSYRGPVVHGRDGSGRTRHRAPAGGLVSALASLPALDTSTVWVCAALNEEDREVAREEGDKPFEVLVGEREVRVRLTRLDPEAQHQTMTIAANPLLWFLQHGLWDSAHAPSFGHR